MKREKTLLELADKEQWKLSEKQKGIEKKELLGELPESHYKKEQWPFGFSSEVAKGLRPPHTTSHRQ